MLNYIDSGSGLPIVLIHGFPLDSRMWRPQIAALSGAGYRVICPDLTGFGTSPGPAGSLSMASYADAVIGLIDKLGIEKAVVGGMSMGGYVLLSLVDRYPDRLLGAMFLMTRATADDAAGKERRTVLANEVNSGNLKIIPDAFAKVLFAPDTPQKKPKLVVEVRQWMESTPLAGLTGGLLAMRDRNDYIAKLGSFTLPSMVVSAEYDMAIPPEHSEVFAKLLPDATLRIIPGAGHMANLENPEAFNQALLEFLSRLRGGEREARKT
jgi:pimeloyl-ACP methyl ester carboxylesterase